MNTFRRKMAALVAAIALGSGLIVMSSGPADAQGPQCLIIVERVTAFDLQEGGDGDEIYFKLKGINAPGITPIIQATLHGETETIGWAWERPGGGRSFGYSGIHYHETWRLPLLHPGIHRHL